MSAPYTPGYGQPPIYNTQQVNFGWIAEAWEIYRKAWIAWLLLNLLPMIFYFCMMVRTYTSPQMLALFSQLHIGFSGNTPLIQSPSPSFAAVSNILLAVHYVILFFVACCSSDIAIRQVRGEVIDNASIFRGMRNFLQMLVFCILWFIAAVVGLIGCCVGTFVTIGLLTPGFALVADGESAVSAFSRSLEGMNREWLMAALLAFVFYLLLSFGAALTCYIGLFVFHPMMFIISALAYRDMIGMPSSDGSGMVRKALKPIPWQQYGQVGFNPQAPGVWPPAPSTGQPQYGQPPMGQSPYGQPPAPNQPPFGQAPPNQSPFGQPSPNQPPSNRANGPDQDSTSGQ